MLHAALKSFLKCDVALNVLGKEIFTAGCSRILGVSLVTVTLDGFLPICGFSMEQNDCFIIQVLLSKSLCQRRLYSEGVSGVVSLFTAGKLSRLRCKNEGVLISADLSQELFLPLGPV